MQKSSNHLKKNKIPTRWFNVLPVLPEKLPPLKDPDDGKESRIEVMKRIRIQELLKQDQATEQWIDIPQKVRDEYAKIGRPTQLMRAKKLEQYLDTPARIYIKREDMLPTSSFKLNTSIAQAYYAKKEGATALVSETGAGQWGLALAYACKIFDLKCLIFWVKVSCEQKRLRALATKLLGAEVFPSPSLKTEAGKQILKNIPNCSGSIGTAIGEAIETAQKDTAYKYVSGSNLPHVLLHQTVIGLETKEQLKAIGECPDTLVACVGGGSNLGGFMNPFLPEKMERENSLTLIGAESDAAPRLTKGEYRYDHADPVGLTPQSLSYTLGMNYMPPPVHVGGLRQHNGSPVIGVLRHSGILEAHSYSQKEAFEAGRLFINCEGIIPAPETCHAIKEVINLAIEAKKTRKCRVIVMCFSGNGLLDLEGYAKVLGL